MNTKYSRFANAERQRLKDGLQGQFKEASVTAYRLAADTGMTAATAYRCLNPDAPSDLTALIAAGRLVGMQLEWVPIEKADAKG